MGLSPDDPGARNSCFFVDDSLSNVRAAKSFGWGSCIWFREQLSAEARAHLVSGDETAAQSALRAPSGAYAEQLKRILEDGDGKQTDGVDAVISSLHQLRDIWPQIFKDSSNVNTTQVELKEA